MVPQYISNKLSCKRKLRNINTFALLNLIHYQVKGCVGNFPFKNKLKNDIPRHMPS